MEEGGGMPKPVPYLYLCTEEESGGKARLRASKILRRSIHIFLSNFHHFTSAPTLLALPFSVALLLLPTSLSPHILPAIHHRIRLLFVAAGFPSSALFSLLSLKLSETLLSTLVTLPFFLSFLVLSKSNVIRSLSSSNSSSSSSSSSSALKSTFISLLLTHLCSSLVLIAAHSTSLSLLTFAFSAADITFPSHSPAFDLIISAAGALFYSLLVAQAVLLCNLAVIVSGCERRGGFEPILKACVMLRGRTSTALALAVPENLAMLAVEWLFRYRVVNSGQFRPAWVVAGEGLLIGYLYSVLVVVDVIIGCFFYRSCSCRTRDATGRFAREPYYQEEEEEGEDEEEVYKEYASDSKKLIALEQGYLV